MFKQANATVFSIFPLGSPLIFFPETTVSVLDMHYGSWSLVGEAAEFLKCMF